jgi:hypothetical protein
LTRRTGSDQMVHLPLEFAHPPRSPKAAIGLIKQGDSALVGDCPSFG